MVQVRKLGALPLLIETAGTAISSAQPCLMKQELQGSVHFERDTIGFTVKTNAVRITRTIVLLQKTRLRNTWPLY